MSRYLSYRDLDEIASRVFRAYKRLPEAQSAGCVLRVDPALLLRGVLGLSIEYRRLSRTGLILGLTSYHETGLELPDETEDLFILDGKTVLIEKALLAEDKQGRRNFTIAHEGCHHVLKMLFPKDYGCGLDARRVLCLRETDGIRTREEWQVDRLASMILMPRELVGQAMYLTGQDGRIDMLNPIWRQKEYESFCRMCGILGVSKQALSLRMKRLGLLGEDHRRDPNRIISIFMEEDEKDE